MGVGIKSFSVLNYSLFFLFIFNSLSLQCCAQVLYSLNASQPLAQGQTLVSPGHIFELGFFTPNNSANKYVGLWHKNISPRKVVWVANREKPLAVADALASLRIGNNGNLELVDGKLTSVWSTNISVSSNSSSAILLDSGNFVVQDDRTGAGLWESFNFPSDTILPSQLLGFNSKSGKRNFLTSWKSENDPSTGKYLVGLTPETPSQVFVWIDGSTPYWRSGPWDKSKFIGIPDMDDRYRSGFSLDDNVILGTKYFSYNFFDSNSVSYLGISSEGIAKLMLSEIGKNWYLNWEAPSNPCDNYGACGPFGVCKASESPMCKCLKGFVPKSDEEWSKGNWTGGCVRQTKLFCEGDTSNDGFWKMVRLKAPDSHEFVVTSLDAENTSDDCKIRCLNNCSCLAYAFVNKIGCLVWSKDLLDIQQFSSGGEDLFIRLAHTELGKGKPIKLIASLTSICSISILVAIVFIWHRFRANQKENGSNWYRNWNAPESPCDRYGACGPFGVCIASESPMCKCLEKFVPKSDEEWSKRNWTGGCVRQTKLFCESNTNESVSSRGNDGFQKTVGLKVPDLHEYITSLEEDTSDDCRMYCLNNCSCLAYAYVSNIGCLVWSKDLIDMQQFSSGGTDIFIRLAQADLGEGKQIKLIVSLTVVCFITILGSILFGLHRLRANKKGTIKLRMKHFESSGTTVTSKDTLPEYLREHDPSELFIYNFDCILIATNNFSITNKLGEGGFGPVYKGKLQDGNEIAVKRLSSSSGQGIEEFKNEMLLISKLQHKNLVKIMGCCVKEDEKLLIYEFMPNKSLDTFLFDPTKRALLDWARRFNIIQGVARGLLYLHHDSCLKVIHRDLKVSNILLDEEMNPKISDFGLARIVQGAQNLVNTQKVVGTLGYISPEYAMGGIFSEKSDVYSFGVLVLEIISSKKNTSFCLYDQQLGFLAYAWHLWSEGRGLDLADEVLTGSYSSSELLRCVHIGLLCVQDNAAHRPTMPDVVYMLSSVTDCPQPKQPVFTFQSPVSAPQPQYVNAFSANEATMSLIEGR